MASLGGTTTTRTQGCPVKFPVKLTTLSTTIFVSNVPILLVVDCYVGEGVKPLQVLSCV